MTLKRGFIFRAILYPVNVYDFKSKKQHWRLQWQLFCFFFQEILLTRFKQRHQFSDVNLFLTNNPVSLHLSRCRLFCSVIFSKSEQILTVSCFYHSWLSYLAFIIIWVLQIHLSYDEIYGIHVIDEKSLRGEWVLESYCPPVLL